MIYISYLTIFQGLGIYIYIYTHIYIYVAARWRRLLYLWYIYIYIYIYITNIAVFFSEPLHLIIRYTKYILIVRICETKFDNFYHLEFSDFCFNLYYYIQNVSTDFYSGSLQVFLVELRSVRGTSNHLFYFILGFAFFHSVNHNQVQELSIPILLLACSQDWTCNLLMISHLEA